MNKAHLNQLIKEILSSPPKKDSCNCGCNSCGTKSTALVLKENKFVHTPISEGLKYHIDNKIPLNENIYRIGSKEYMKLYEEARFLYSRNRLDVNEEDKYFLTETHIGNFGIFEGKKVPLDIPMIHENENTDEELKREYDNILSREYELTRIYQNDRTEENWIKLTQFRKKGKSLEKKLAKRGLIDSHLAEDKKNPPIGKPKRGGSKKFYVYVKNPKTKKIKKVSFGDTTGLSVKLNNPKARKAFAARHNCKDKKDRTKAGYWSCNLPRYAKQLGLGANMNTYW
jgi:hypothetical protein